MLFFHFLFVSKIAYFFNHLIIFIIDFLMKSIIRIMKVEKGNSLIATLWYSLEIVELVLMIYQSQSLIDLQDNLHFV